MKLTLYSKRPKDYAWFALPLLGISCVTMCVPDSAEIEATAEAERISALRLAAEEKAEIEAEAARKEQARLKEIAEELAKLQAENKARDDEVSRIQSLSQNDRALLLKRCVLDSPEECSLGVEATIEASPEKERVGLKRAVGIWNKQKDRAVKARRRGSAPLQCCDGSTSPSCTCGNPKRGCCSHHGGVCGCSM